MIDLSTIRSLELIQNLQNAKSRDCLFGLLNGTMTPMGARLLRSNVLQPLTDAEVLNRRLDALDELTVKEDMFSAVRQGLWLSHVYQLCAQYLTILAALKGFLDADKLLTSVCASQAFGNLTVEAKNNNNS
jgi:DNA mismatch repair protein MSH4